MCGSGPPLTVRWDLFSDRLFYREGRRADAGGREKVASPAARRKTIWSDAAGRSLARDLLPSAHAALAVKRIADIAGDQAEATEPCRVGLGLFARPSREYSGSR